MTIERPIPMSPPDAYTGYSPLRTSEPSANWPSGGAYLPIGSTPGPVLDIATGSTLSAGTTVTGAGGLPTLAYLNGSSDAIRGPDFWAITVVDANVTGPTFISFMWDVTVPDDYDPIFPICLTYTTEIISQSGTNPQSGGALPLDATPTTSDALIELIQYNRGSAIAAGDQAWPDASVYSQAHPAFMTYRYALPFGSATYNGTNFGSCKWRTALVANPHTLSDFGDPQDFFTLSPGEVCTLVMKFSGGTYYPFGFAGSPDPSHIEVSDIVLTFNCGGTSAGYTQGHIF